MHSTPDLPCASDFLDYLKFLNTFTLPAVYSSNWKKKKTFICLENSTVYMQSLPIPLPFTPLFLPHTLSHLRHSYSTHHYVFHLLTWVLRHIFLSTLPWQGLILIQASWGLCSPGSFKPVAIIFPSLPQCYSLYLRLQGARNIGMNFHKQLYDKFHWHSIFCIFNLS